MPPRIDPFTGRPVLNNGFGNFGVRNSGFNTFGSNPIQDGLNFGGLTPDSLVGTQAPNALTPTALTDQNTGQLFDGVNLSAQPNSTGFFGNLQNQFESNPLGAIGTGAQAAGSLAGIYFGFQALNNAEDQLDFTRSSFNRQFNAQERDVQREIEDRDRRRRSASPGAFA